MTREIAPKDNSELNFAFDLPPDARCLKCRYSLKGLTQPRCPECGQPFDPNDLSTVFTTQSSQAKQRMAAPPGRPSTVCAWGIAVAILYGSSVPGGSSLICVFGGLAIAICMLVFCIRIVESANLKHYREAQGWAHWKRWVKIPAILITSVALSYIGVPLYLRFFISLPIMNNFVENALADPNSVPTETWIGLYPARDIEAANGCVGFIIPGTGFIDTYGFVYNPDHQKWKHSNECIRLDQHFWEPWYIAEDHW